MTPQTSATRLLYLLNSLIGLSVLSLTLSYFVQVYAALQQRTERCCIDPAISGLIGSA